MLDEELQRTAIEFYSKPVPHLLYCTSYQDAVSPPFPDDGKRGLSIYVGKLRQFRQPEVALLWALEKKRGRARVVVVTDLRGKDFIPAYRELGSCLGDPHLAPLNFLRRRKDKWDTLDFFSCGRSPSMEGAASRLKRFKQQGWECLVDRLALTDQEIKAQYYDSLFVQRDRLQTAFDAGMRAGRVSAMVGIAGRCLQKEHLPMLLTEACLSRLVKAIQPEETSNEEEGTGWTYLGKRERASELLLFTEGERWLEAEDVLKSEESEDGKALEVLVSELRQRVQFSWGSKLYTAIRVAVEWRYPPLREIPVRWTQNSTLPAG